MKKILTLAVAAITLCASLAAAKPVGINLYGYPNGGSNKCGDPAGLAATMTGTCGAIGNAMTLVSGVVVPRNLLHLAGVTQEIDVVTTSPAVPDYWRLDVCRGGKTTPTMNAGVAVDGANCVATIWDYNGGSAPIAVEGYSVDPSFPNTLHMDMGAAVASPFDVPFDGNELGVASLLIKNGPTSCAGCNLAACLLLKFVNLAEDGNPTPPRVTNPINSNYAVWIGNGPAAPGNFCPAATPTTNRTWGQLKSLYR